MAHQHVQVVLLDQHGDGVRGGPQVQQAAVFRSLLNPGIVVAVAVEDDTLVLPDGALDQIVQGRTQVGGALQLVCKQPQGLGHGGIQHDVGAGDGIAGAQHAELEFIAGKGKGRGAVAV